MSPLRQEALRLLETVPEENLHALIQALRAAKLQPAETNAVEQKRRALDNIQRIIGNKNTP